MQTVNTAEAKAKLSELMAKVEASGDPILLARRGRPVVALIRVDDLERLQQEPAPTEPGGALALVGAWSKYVTDEEVDQMVRDIYEQRQRDVVRPVELPE